MVMLQNEAKLPPHLVARTQALVTRLFNEIDVGIDWVNDLPTSGGRLRVVSLTNWEPDDRAVDKAALGITPVEEAKAGVRGYVFWPRIQRASQKFTASLDNLLAAAIAHELGHMLLPYSAHESRGLMHSPWDASHFGLASAGLLAFSPETAASIRRELADRITAR